MLGGAVLNATTFIGGSYSNDQKIGEMLYVGGGMLSFGYLASKWL